MFILSISRFDDVKDGMLFILHLIRIADVYLALNERLEIY